MRRIGGLLVALLIAVTAAPPARAERFSPAAWAEDLDELRDALTARYPNLEWQAQRGLDLAYLHSAVRQRLLDAPDEYVARDHLVTFAKLFADVHFEVGWEPARPPQTASAPSRPKPLCERFGYRGRPDRRALASQLTGFRPIATEGQIKVGVVDVGGRKVGVLRLQAFQPESFPALCEEVMAEAKLQAGSPCEGPCQDDFVLRADRAFAREMRRQLTALAAERPDVLLIDIAANGGGDDSSLLLARLVTDRPVRKPRAAFIRTPRTAEMFGERRAVIHAAAERTRGPERAALQRFEAALARAEAEAQVPCDRSPLWRNQPMACTGLVEEPRYDGPMPTPGATLPDWMEYASAVARYGDLEPIWRGPLVVLVDGDTASSSEMFAAMLQDAKAAVVLGAPTAGAGCGHATGAGPITLTHSHALVVMPDCARFRADGANEVAGIQPEVLTGFRQYDTPKQRAALVGAALPRAIEAALAQRR